MSFTNQNPFPGFCATALVGHYVSTHFLVTSQFGCLVVFCIWRSIRYSLEHVTVFCYSYNIDVTKHLQQVTDWRILNKLFTMNVLCKWSKNKFNKGRAKEGSSTEPCPVYERIKLPAWSISPGWGGRWSIAELSLCYYIGDNYSYTPWEGSWSKVSYLRNNALAERDLTMRRMWLEQKKILRGN